MAPTSPRNTVGAGFVPLGANDSTAELHHRSGDHVVNIPLTPVLTSASRHVKIEDSATPQGINHLDTGFDSMGNRVSGRRKLVGPGIGPEEARGLTKVGRFWEKLLNASIIIRYFVYIFPVSAILAIPTIIGAIGPGRNTTIGGVRMVWFFSWIQIIWVSLWVSKLVSKTLPFIFQAVIGIVSSGVKKYATVIRALELPISLVGWAVTCLTTFTPIMTRNPDSLRTGNTSVTPWMARMNAILGACLVSSLVYLIEKIFVQLVSVNYHRKQFEQRIKDNKHNVKLLSELYDVSRKLFPEYTEFPEEDYLIHAGLAGLVLTPGNATKKNGSATPMRQLVGNLNVVSNKVTSAVGNVAREVTGRNVFNPNSSYSIVLEALGRKDSAEALAKRIWMSFVAEGSDALSKEDLLEVMGSNHQETALECFAMLDKDDNGDVSLDEMIQGVEQMRVERRDVAKSVRDVDNAIGVLDNVLSTIVFVIVVFVFVAFNFQNFNTMLAAAGTMLLSLSFVFSITAQEVLGSCIFLFVKHPYDVGDRVDIGDNKFVVQHISLLYTVFRRVDSGKTSQAPNNVLNTQWIENVTRSKNMQETLKVSVNFDTTFEDVQALKDEMLSFIKENNRDYRPDFDIEIASVNDLDKLDLKLQIQHKGNWANGDLATQRRNKFICALTQALRKIPIYGPGGGGASIGEEAKPLYTVAISDQEAKTNAEKAAKEKSAKRWDYHDSDSSDGDSFNEKGRLDPKSPYVGSGSGSEQQRNGFVNTNASSATAVGLDLDFGSSDYASNQRAGTAATGYAAPTMDNEQSGLNRRRTNRNSSGSRHQDLEEVRSMLHKSSTRGRRRVADVSSPVNPASPRSIASSNPNNPYLQRAQSVSQQQNTFNANVNIPLQHLQHYGTAPPTLHSAQQPAPPPLSTIHSYTSTPSGSQPSQSHNHPMGPPPPKRER